MIALPPVIFPPEAVAYVSKPLGGLQQQRAAGIVSTVAPGRIMLFAPKTRRLLTLTVPRDFHGVDSNDGVIRNAPDTRVRPGMLADVTYRSAYGRRVVTHVELLTQAACTRLTGSEWATGARPGCPD